MIEPAPGGQQATFGELVPDWVAPVVWQLGVAVVLAAWWRARRLGPVVAEPLPVVVRAAETTEAAPACTAVVEPVATPPAFCATP